MAKTVEIEDNKPAQNQEQDQYGYYTVNVNQIYDPEDPRFGVSTIVKLKQKVQPADGTDEVKVAISFHPKNSNKIDVPDSGFSVLMESVFISRVGDMMQGVLAPAHINGLVGIGANYVETMLINLPFSVEEYVLLAPGGEFFATVDLYQPPVELTEEEDPTLEDGVAAKTISNNIDSANRSEGTSDIIPKEFEAEIDSGMVSAT